jgi:hypothetical protein
MMLIVRWDFPARQARNSHPWEIDGESRFLFDAAATSG